jgi:hypothetical protein
MTKVQRGLFGPGLTVRKVLDAFVPKWAVRITPIWLFRRNWNIAGKHRQA